MENKDVLIIKELLGAGEEFVSGSDLAERLGISRVAIWSHMEKLRAQGFDFEAIRSKGYRMTAKPEALNEALIKASLPTSSQTLHLKVMDETDSTNTEAERCLANAVSTPLLVVARRQSQGRGRLGRVWHSPLNSNLYASFAFRPKVSPAKMSAFTLWMGLNICECINAFCRVQAKVKWPNDLLIDGKKVAGILTEARMDADETRDVVLGLGLNINSDEADWPDELKEIATSLKEASGRQIDLNRLTAVLAGRVLKAYQQFVGGEHPTPLKEKWPEYDVLYGKPVSLLQGGSRITGVAKGIDSHGALILERPDNSRFQVRAGEVTIEK